MRNDVKKTGKNASEQLVASLVILIGLLLAAQFLRVQQWLRSFNDWVGQMGLAGIFIFIAVSAAATLGASLAFLVARFVARDKIEAMARRNTKFQRIDNAIGKQGAKLVFLLRLIPVIPFNLSNYFYGLTAVKFWPYVLA